MLHGGSAILDASAPPVIAAAASVPAGRRYGLLGGRCAVSPICSFIRPQKVPMHASSRQQVRRDMDCRIPGSPSWPIGPQGLLRLLSRTMPDFPMMRCAFLWPILVSSAASSGMRQARSSFVSLPSTIYEAPFRPWPAAGRNRAVSRFRIGCAECGVQVSLSPRSRSSLLWASPSSPLPPACASAGAGTRSSLSFNM